MIPESNPVQELSGMIEQGDLQAKMPVA